MQVTSKDVFVLRFVATPVLEESHGIGSCRYSVLFQSLSLCLGIGNNGLPSEEWWVEDHAHQVLCIYCPFVDVTVVFNMCRFGICYQVACLWLDCV
jgi:hypothetical protein